MENKKIAVDFIASTVAESYLYFHPDSVNQLNFTLILCPIQILLCLGQNENGQTELPFSLSELLDKYKIFDRPLVILKEGQVIYLSNLTIMNGFPKIFL
jgi:hypothetical protein